MSSHIPLDKVRISAYYDEADGRCHNIDVTLNYDGISREDLTETIKAVFHPDVDKAGATFRNRELGSTDVIHVEKNGRPVAGQAPAETQLNLHRIGR